MIEGVIYIYIYIYTYIPYLRGIGLSGFSPGGCKKGCTVSKYARTQARPP